ncbi:MAG: right-handed parallel beta-helix repeat-containing protein, partial [Thermoguttaceae bacterium]
HRPVLLKGCSNVLIEGATLQFAGISCTQGRVKAIGADAKGNYFDWQIDAGYPTDIDPIKSTYNVIDRHTRLLKAGAGDCGAKQAEPLGPGLFRLRQFWGPMSGAAIDDWLVTRAPGGSTIVHLDDCKGCTMQEITLLNSGFAAFFETGGEGGHRYLDCRVARGPKPAGVTEEQLVSCGADGFHSAGTRTGPTFQHCTWEGVLLDDCIAVHGSFQKVIRAEGTRLILEKGNRGNFAVNEPVRISSKSGFFGQAKCVALRTLNTPQSRLELTLDQALPVPPEAKAGNPERCGKGFKILDCTLGNTRSRGILVKGDDGIIQGCTIEGCGMSAVSIGPEYWWGEADYCWNVTVTGNTFRHNVLNGSEAGVVLVHGDGAVGNRHITIRDNHFQENYGLFMMNVEDTDGLKISGNVFQGPFSPALLRSGSMLKLVDGRNIVLQGNVVSTPGFPPERLLNLGRDVEGVNGNEGFDVQPKLKEIR